MGAAAGGAQAHLAAGAAGLTHGDGAAKPIRNVIGDAIGMMLYSSGRRHGDAEELQ